MKQIIINFGLLGLFGILQLQTWLMHKQIRMLADMVMPGWRTVKREDLLKP
jgi:hypothetical protein